MKKMILLLCCYTLLSAVNAQQLVQERLYKLGSANRGFGSSTLTREGNVVLTGSYLVNPGYQSVFTLVKPDGDTLWLRNGTYLATGGIGIRQTSGSGFAFYTTKAQTSPLASGTALLKYDGNGVLKWTVPYAINTFDLGFLLLSAPDSGYYLGGKNIINGRNRSFALSRTDSLGNVKWRKGYNWRNSDFLADIQHTANGNIVMYGLTGSPQRLKLLLVNQDGDSVLGRQLSIIGDPNRSERMRAAFCGVTPLSDGGFLLAAEIDTNAVNAASFLGMVVKVDASLNPVWHYINHSVPDNVTFTRSRELADGSVVMLAYERKGVVNEPGNKFFLYRFSSTGTLLNVYPFTCTIAIQVQALTMEAIATDSSFIIGGSGTVTSAPNDSYGFYVAKVKIAGLPPALPLPLPVTVTGIKKEIAANRATLGQSYPNPTQAEAIIPYSLPKDCRKAVITINEVVTGRQVKSYMLKTGENNLPVDLSKLSSGMYTYTLLVDEKQVATKKLSVIR